MFIRTVHKFPKRDEELLEPLPGLEQSIHDQVLEPTNKCGCVDKTTTKMTVIAFAVFIGFMVIAFAAFGRSNAVGFTIFFLVGIIGLIVSFVGCNLRCCSCCKAPHGIDDE